MTFHAMKKHLFTLIAMLLGMAMTVEADEIKGLTLGYCDGVAVGSGKIGTTDKDAWNSLAVRIPAGETKTYAGCHIDSLRMALASKINVDSVVMWLRTSLDGDNVAQCALAKADLKKGWNQAPLDAAYTIPASLADGLYIGYSYHQKSSAKPASIVGQPAAGALFVKLGDEEWKDRSDEGALSMEALVFGDNLPKLNLALKSIELQKVFVVDKGTLKVTATVKNLAAQTVTGLDFATTISDLDGSYAAHVDTTIAYRETKTVSFTITPAIKETTPEARAVTVTLAKFNEGDDENMDDNTLTDSIEVVGHDFTRCVLLEEFTTEKCTNCPRMAGYIKTALASGKYDGRLNVVCHHSGYYTDWLSTSFDTDYLWFFNAGGSTYAPAVMFDRDAFGESTPVSCPSSQEQMEAYIDYCLVQPAYVSLNIEPTLDGDTLRVKVTGERSKEDFTNGLAPRICVTVLENDITARSQAGASNFVHEHVNRAINNTWGEELTWNGDSYEYDCKFTLRTTWERKNMQVLAYIYGYDNDDATNCRVANSAMADFPQADPSSIKAVGGANGGAKEYFTLEGRKVSTPLSGLHIVKQGGRTWKEMVK